MLLIDSERYRELEGRRSRCRDQAMAWTVQGSKCGSHGCSFLEIVRTGSGAHTTSCSVGTGFLSGGEIVVDRSRLSNAEVKNEWSYTSALPVHLRGVGRGKFNFLACFLPEKSISMVSTLEFTVGVQVVANGLFDP